MRAGTIVEANRALSSLRSHADSLAQVEIPRLLGRGEARRSAANLTTLAAEDAERAATTLLETGGFAPEAIESVRRAARLLRRTPANAAAVRSAGTILAETVDQARASYAAAVHRDPELVALHMSQLAGRDANGLARADWKTAIQLLDADPAGAVLRGPRALDGLPALRELAELNATRGMYGADQRIAQSNQYLASWRLVDVPDAARSEELGSLIQRERGLNSKDEWSRLLTLVDADPHGRLVPGARRLAGAPPLRDVLERLSKRGRDTDRDLATVERYAADWRLATRSTEERAQLLRSLVAREPTSLDVREWSTLHELLTNDPGIRGPRTLSGLISFPEIAARNVERPLGGAGMENTKRYFAAWRLAGSPPEQRIATARSLIDRDVSELTPDDWRDLRTILDSDPEAAILRAPREIDGLRTFRALVNDGAEHPLYSAGGVYQVNRYLSAWRHELDPDYPAKLAAAVEDVAAGQPSQASRRLVAGEGHRLAELVAGRPADQQSAIAIEMLDTPGVAATRGVEGTLQMLRAGLADAASADPAIATVRDQTLALIDRNLARLAGRTPDGAVVGFGRHPDYAEVGRVRSNLMLLDQLDRAAATAPRSPTPAPAGVEVLPW